VLSPYSPSYAGRFNTVRLLCIIAMVAAVVVLLHYGQPAQQSGNDHQWLQFTPNLTLPGDILYRLSVAAEASGNYAQAKTWQQTALALYERSGLGAAASAPAVHRLGIFYSKLGYPDHGQRFLLYAAQLDDSRRDLCLLLSAIYADEETDQTQWLSNASLLEQQPRWLAGLTRIDMWQRMGQQDRSQQLRRQWVGRQVIFSKLASGLVVVYGLLGLVGLLVSGYALIGLLGQPARRLRQRMYVPWRLIDMTEVVVVLVLAMVVLTKARGYITEHLHLDEQSGLTPAVIIALIYLASVGIALAVIWYRLRSYRGSLWQMLGLRSGPWGRLVGWGVAGYGVFIFILGVGWLVLRQIGVLGSLPAIAAQIRSTADLIAQAGDPRAYLVYFALICLIGPLVEEIIFRGFVYAGLRRMMGMVPAVVLSAALFASIHLSAPAGGMLMVGLIGAVLAYLYERTHSLLPSIVAHAVHNTLLFVLLSAYGLL